MALDVMPTHTWKSHTIEVRTRAIAKMAWLGLGFTVLVDGEVRGTSPNRFEGMRTQVPFDIPQRGDTMATGYLRSGRPLSVLRAPYKLVIEGEEVASGVAMAANWYMTYLALPLLILVAYSLVRMFA